MSMFPHDGTIQVKVLVFASLIFSCHRLFNLLHFRPYNIKKSSTFEGILLPVAMILVSDLSLAQVFNVSHQLGPAFALVKTVDDDPA